MAQTFEFPKIHAFPPLYTQQPNSTVLQNQLELWGEIILLYCQHYKITELTPQGKVLHTQNEDLDISQLPLLFENGDISRTVNDAFRKLIINHLIHKLNKAEYVDPQKPESGILVYWRSLSEWGKLLYDHVDRTGQLGTVVTVYELTKLEDSGIPVELRNMGYALLVRVLKKVLIKQGKAQIIMEEDSDQIGGVKIV